LKILRVILGRCHYFELELAVVQNDSGRLTIIDETKIDTYVSKLIHLALTRIFESTAAGMQGFIVKVVHFGFTYADSPDDLIETCSMACFADAVPNWSTYTHACANHQWTFTINDKQVYPG